MDLLDSQLICLLARIYSGSSLNLEMTGGNNTKPRLNFFFDFLALF